MRTKLSSVLKILFFIVPISTFSQSAFRAEMINVRSGSERVYRIQSDGSKYRYDFEESGMKGIVIVDPIKGKTAILMPDEKYVHYTDINSRTSLMNDPYQSFQHMKKKYEEKQAGRETVSGYECDKKELYASDRKIVTAWYSDKLGFLLKMVNNTSENTFMELREIKPGKIDESIFMIPDNYTEVDERMRPVIPEPPAPDSWEMKKASIPMKGEFKRGDLISFDIPESRNYIVILNNNTDKPAKIIRIGMRDGKELPDNEQGPLSYRSRRLYAGESFNSVYSWKAGDEKLIQVHEGIINIEIIPENK